MREIIFRGKRIDGKCWAYGTYYFGVMYPTSFQGHYVNDHLIDENTLGQFTGLHDKNGVKIFEGDILSCNRSGFMSGNFSNIPAIVKWKNDLISAKFILDPIFRGWTSQRLVAVAQNH